MPTPTTGQTAETAMSDAIAPRTLLNGPLASLRSSSSNAALAIGPGLQSRWWRWAETVAAVRGHQQKVGLQRADGYAGLKVLTRLRQGS